MLMLSLFGVGHAWLFYVIHFATANQWHVSCLFKHVTGIPCPSCGTTTAVRHLLEGDFIGALSYNPLGYIVGPALVVVPIWILSDLVRRRDTFFKAYVFLEEQLRRKKVYFPLLLLLLVVWGIKLYSP